MQLVLARWGSFLNHLWWRLGIVLPMIFTQYTSEDESHAERSLSGWKLGFVSIAVIGISVLSFFM